jgi:carbonic anhydrase/acetyltransferase-like protein (isoleucine patch superfamily)
MAVYALGDVVPSIHPDAWVHPDAVVIGNVTIGAESSIWPSAVLRGDSGVIEVGARTSIQDGSVLHTTAGFPTVVGDECVVGHLVHLEGCTIEDVALVGNGSIVLHGAVVRTGGLVGANAVVRDGVEIPTAMMGLGVPAKLRESSMSQTDIRALADGYVAKAARYRAEMRRID